MSDDEEVRIEIPVGVARELALLLGSGPARLEGNMLIIGSGGQHYLAAKVRDLHDRPEEGGRAGQAWTRRTITLQLHRHFPGITVRPDSPHQADDAGHLLNEVHGRGTWTVQYVGDTHRILVDDGTAYDNIQEVLSCLGGHGYGRDRAGDAGRDRCASCNALLPMALGDECDLCGAPIR